MLWAIQGPSPTKIVIHSLTKMSLVFNIRASKLNGFRCISSLRTGTIMTSSVAVTLKILLNCEVPNQHL